MKNDIRHTIYNSDAIHALCVFGAFGVLGVLIDLDHFPGLIWKNISINTQNLLTYAGRPLHIPLLIFFGLLCIYSGASLYRLHPRSL
ncbi:MAG: hypothetical protein ABIJ34_08500 [archaeon]